MGGELLMRISISMRRDIEGNLAPINAAWIPQVDGSVLPERILRYVGTLYDNQERMVATAFGETDGEVMNILREHQLKMEGRL